MSGLCSQVTLFFNKAPHTYTTLKSNGKDWSGWISYKVQDNTPRFSSWVWLGSDSFYIKQRPHSFPNTNQVLPKHSHKHFNDAIILPDLVGNKTHLVHCHSDVRYLHFCHLSHTLINNICIGRKCNLARNAFNKTYLLSQFSCKWR